MFRYVKGYIYEGHTFVVNKSDIHNAKGEQFAEGTALMPDGWISVKDRLPDKEDEFLVYHSALGMEIASFDFYITKKFQRPDDNGYEYEVYAEYWRPLPEPPKGDDEDED